MSKQPAKAEVRPRGDFLILAGFLLMFLNIVLPQIYKGMVVYKLMVSQGARPPRIVGRLEFF